MFLKNATSICGNTDSGYSAKLKHGLRTFQNGRSSFHILVIDGNTARLLSKEPILWWCDMQIPKNFKNDGTER